MPIINRMAELHNEITEWRREIHSNPELMYDVHDTASSVEEKLRAFGCDEVVTEIGKTGVVGIIHGKSRESGRVIGMRADMDALPIEEATGKPHKSRNPGKMHACGHDGHTAMLLGAAKYLAETRNFNGSVAVIFQPAEEGGAGGKAMVDDGMMDRFGINEVYGMHNLPGLPVGEFAINSGAVMAATDEFQIKVTGRGAHAAMPHQGVDPVVVASQIVIGLQTIVSRNLNPFEPLVVTATKINGGTAFNVIPDEVEVVGTIRSLSDEARQYAIRRMREISEGIAASAGAKVGIEIIEDIRLPSIMMKKLPKLPKLQKWLLVKEEWTPTRKRQWVGRIFPTCCWSDPEPLYSWEMAIRQGFIIPNMISMTRPFHMALPIGRNWLKR